jgi:hypothetical protein
MGRRLLETTHLWLFFVVVFGVIVLPGSTWRSPSQARSLAGAAADLRRSPASSPAASCT